MNYHAIEEGKNIRTFTTKESRDDWVAVNQNRRLLTKQEARNYCAMIFRLKKVRKDNE